jgi:hypothetical protein
VSAPEAEFIAFDQNGVMTKETWLATVVFCPHCGTGSGAVWALTSTPLVQVGNVQTRIFLCVSCGFVGFGLNGFKPGWDVEHRAKQIVEHGFGDPPKEPSNNLIV